MLPEVSLTIVDPNLGIVPESTDDISAAIGLCSGGATGQVYSFGDKQLVKSTLGQGPLVEYACHLLDVAGGPVLCVKQGQATAGAAGAVTKNGTGPEVTVAGAAYDAYSAVVKITGGGVRGTATFRYSLDGGTTFSPDIVVPSGGSYPVPDSGLTLSFAAGTYVLDDTYTFACTAPAGDATTLAAALDTLLADPREWRFVKVVGQAADASGSATLAATLKTKMDAAATAYRYARAFMDAADATDANLITGFAAFESGRVVVGAGMEELLSSVSGRYHSRPIGWSGAARAAKVPVHEDLGQVSSGSLQGVRSLARDERNTPGLDAQRFMTARSFLGLPGFYITAGRTMAAQTSDYQRIQNGFVMDKACRAARSALLRYLNSSVRVDRETGYILEADAQAIEAEVQAMIEASVIASGNASAVEVKVSRTENILSTGTLRVAISVTPLGYMHSIATEIGLKNPALTPVAQ